MRVQMLEYLQGVGVSGQNVETGETVTILEPQGIYEVDPSLADFILDTQKGVATSADARPYKKVKPAEEVKTEEAAPEGEPLMTTDNQAVRGKKK